MKILFVCMGNICRSPIAAGIMRKLLDDVGLSDYHVDSVGTKDWNLGHSADSRAVQACARKGVDIKRHSARQVAVADFEKFDLIFVVDDQNERDLRRIAPKCMQDRIHRLPDPQNPQGFLDVPDPYHGDARGFASCFDLLEDSLRVVLNELIRKNAG